MTNSMDHKFLGMNGELLTMGVIKLTRYIVLRAQDETKRRKAKDSVGEEEMRIISDMERLMYI